MDDEQLTVLALSARDGGRAEIEAFVRATHRDVWRFVAHLTDPQSADDLAQETFLRALGSLPRFAGRASARTWLLSIARRVVVDRYRRNSVRPRSAALPDWRETVEQQQPMDLPGFDEGVALTDLLAAVPPARREAFVLTQITGLSYAEAAEVAGCPVGTVRSRVARAREQLVELLLAAESAVPEAVPAGSQGGSGCPGSSGGPGRTVYGTLAARRVMPVMPAVPNRAVMACAS